MDAILETPTFNVNGLKIPIVQELATKFAQNTESRSDGGIPGRYIRSEDERPVSNLWNNNISVPLIDMSLLPESPQQMEKLAHACEDWGFFQIVNHGIPLGLLEKIMKVCKEFFNLPLEEKRKYSDPEKSSTPYGYGQGFIFSEDQPLEWSDLLFLVTHPAEAMEPMFWPKSPPDFRETMEAYSIEMQKLITRILKLFALNLGLKSDTAIVDSTNSYFIPVRVNYYPPCPKPELTMGLSSHTDSSIITILLQDDDVEGLQINKRDKGWVTVKPVPGALVINIGDSLEVKTNGRYRSIEHRAITNSIKPRMSVVAFHTPNPEEVIGPLAELVDKEHPALYKTFERGDYNNYIFANRLLGKKRSSDFIRLPSQ